MQFSKLDEKEVAGAELEQKADFREQLQRGLNEALMEICNQPLCFP